MAPLLFLLFLVVPILELYVIVQVGSEIGALWTVLLLLGISILGAALIKREGARTFAALRASIAAGRMPTRELADGFLVMLGGALLLAPGFLTDAVGLLLVLPVTRPLARKVLGVVAGRRVRLVGTVACGMRRGNAAPRPGRRPAYDDVIDGEVVEPDGPPGKSDRPDQIGRAG